MPSIQGDPALATLSSNTEQEAWMGTSRGGGGVLHLCSSKGISLFFAINFLMFIVFFLHNSPRKDSAVGNYAYITLANNEGYAKGAVALAMSLFEVGSLYPLLVLVTSGVPKSIVDMLEGIGCIVYHIESLPLPPQLALQAERWGPAFTKFMSWERTEYDKLIFMDSDLLVLKNVDGLFRTGADDIVLATVDADASSCSFQAERLKLINSGLMVLTPSHKTFSSLVKTLHNETLLAGGALNDQDILARSLPWVGLPYPMYGAQVTHCECSDNRLWDLENTKILHFTAGLRKLPKPWDDLKGGGGGGIPSCAIPLFELWRDRYADGERLGLLFQNG